MTANIEVVRGDITEQAVDAIVNAANKTLLGGGGVDGAIHWAAGPKLIKECMTLGGCPTGEARITLGYQLSAKHVIHTVGPVWRGGTNGEPQQLANCYRASMALAVENNLRSIAFPSISTGAYGYPLGLAVMVAVTTVKSFLDDDNMIDLVRFVCFGEDAYDAYTGMVKSDA